MNKRERINKAVMGCEGDDYHEVMRASVTHALRNQAGFIPGKIEPIPDGLSTTERLYHVAGIAWFLVLKRIRDATGIMVHARMTRRQVAEMLSKAKDK